MNHTTIHVLPPEVAARIAAGEVVERPASVVRELLDNAIDAGASRITVEIEDGGLTLIRVVDDGQGIPPGDVELAFERHATSKISRLEDLARISSLGFRGEALPSIAAAADVDVVTRHVKEPVGVQLTIVDGKVARRQARAAPVGTSIAVLDLFRRLPARRKFLGTPTGEARAVAALVAHYALAYPAVAIRFVSGDRTAMRTPGDGDTRHAFAAVYNAKMAAAMLPVEHEDAGIRVTGLVSPPDVTRGNRAGISFFINGRWVQSRPLVFAATDAYQSLLPSGRFPVISLAVAIPPDEVDVNVHPAKAEVRFRDERSVARCVRQAVSLALGLAPVAVWQGREGAASPATGPRPPLRERLADALQRPAPLQARFTSPPSPRADPGATPSRPQREALPLLRVVGQVMSSFIVCEGPDGLYLLDQHAAHERVLYDRLTGRRSSTPIAQPLLEPALLEVDLALASTAEACLRELADSGLVLEPFGERTFLVRAVPAGAGTVDPPTLAREVLEELTGEPRVPRAESVAATIACHSSVRAGMSMTGEEMKQLLLDLEATALPRTCPHGRPTLVHLSRVMIERQFGRR